MVLDEPGKVAPRGKAESTPRGAACGPPGPRVGPEGGHGGHQGLGVGPRRPLESGAGGEPGTPCRVQGHRLGQAGDVIGPTPTSCSASPSLATLFSRRGLEWLPSLALSQP